MKGSGEVELELGGEALVLLAERAVWWPAAEALFVADLHMGKEATFRAAGVPVPDVVARDLERLAASIQRLNPSRLFILGDLVHAREGYTPEITRAFTQFIHSCKRQGASNPVSHSNDASGAVARKRKGASPPVPLSRSHSDLPITLVRGNHDRRAGDPPAEWRIDCVDEPAEFRGVQLRHYPTFDDERPTLAGHLHPKYRLTDGPDRLRLPCFLRRRHTLVLPAFGQFIDHHVIAPEPSDSLFIIADTEVVPVTGPRSRILPRRR